MPYMYSYFLDFFPNNAPSPFFIEFAVSKIIVFAASIFWELLTVTESATYSVPFNAAIRRLIMSAAGIINSLLTGS